VLDVRRLLVLREVARCGSLSAAAEALTYTTSAVSQQIAALERQAGVALVERRPRGAVLTPAGVVLVEHATRVLDALADAEGALAELSAVRAGTLRIASFATAGATVVPRAVDTFRARHPHIDIRVEQSTSSDGIGRLRQGRLDVVLAVDQEPAPDLDVIDLFDDPFRIAMHRSHPLAGRARLSLADLRDERWIDVPRTTAGSDILARAGISHRVTYESDDYTAIHELVGAGLGVALLPDLALLPDNPNVVFHSLGAGAPVRRIQAVTRPAAVRSAAASAMVDILRALEPRRLGRRVG
jgi:DNA-binding transcriptional LysR family regulator